MRPSFSATKILFRTIFGICSSVGALPTFAHLQAMADVYPIKEIAQPLSGDGNVALVTSLDGKHLYTWTPAHGAKEAKMPSNGKAWDSEYFITNTDGSVIVGGGFLSANNWQADWESAWIWNVGVNFRDYIRRNYNSANIGVSPDGTIVIRQEKTEAGTAVIYRVLGPGVTAAWAYIAASDEVMGATSDGNALFGQSLYGPTKCLLPTYWDGFGNKIQCTALASLKKTCLGLYASKDGRIIFGRIMNYAVLPDESVVERAFSWNTASNHVTIYIDSPNNNSFPYLVSPDGNVVMYSTNIYNQTPGQLVIVDSTTPADAAKGPQALKAWMVSKDYITQAQADALDFIPFGMSNDQSVIVGNYGLPGDHSSFHGFYARKG